MRTRDEALAFRSRVVMETGKATIDAIEKGVGWLRVNPDGSLERIDPATITIIHHDGKLEAPSV